MGEDQACTTAAYEELPSAIDSQPNNFPTEEATATDIPPQTEPFQVQDEQQHQKDTKTKPQHNREDATIL